MIVDSAVTDAVTLLDKNPDYKVIRRISSRNAFAQNDGRGVIVKLIFTMQQCIWVLIKKYSKS